MVVPVAEIITFTASEAYVSKPTETLAGFLQILDSTEGQIRSYHGLRFEDESDVKKGYIAILWETYEAHAALQSSERYPTLRAALSLAAQDGREMVHALFKADSAPSFAAPIVEFAWFKLKDGTSLDAVARHMDKLVAADTATVVSATWGPVREEGREFQFVMVVGWQSHEAHMAAVQSPTENVKKLVADIMEFSTVQISHSKMVAYP